MLHLIEQQQGSGGPDRHQGVWVSPDGNRVLMLVRLRVAGSDIDGEQRSLEAIQSAFQGGITDQDKAVRLLVTGPPVFAVEARDRIRSDAERLSTLAGLIVATTLLLVYRSPRILLLAFVPVISGALAGIAAVGFVFRTVHGITLGFGATLIGEAVDYAVYLFTQTAPDSPVERTIQRIWPTLRLGVLTSICGFAAMLLSSFEGFAQLGLFTITGLAVAVCVTRWVLPALLPKRFVGVRQSPFMLRIARAAIDAGRFRKGLAILAVAAATLLVMDPSPFWATDLNSLSPVSPAEQRLDRSLRRDMREPDSPLLIVIHRPDQETALQAAEKLGEDLQPLVHRGVLAGFDTPSRYLPSLATQQARRDALPDPAVLRDNLDAALDGLPFQPSLFTPFVTDISQARSAGPISRADLDGTSISLRLDSLLVQQSDGWLAVLPLRGVTEPTAVARAMANEPDVTLVDLKAESDRLLGVFLREGISLACLGAAAIGVLLLVSLRSWQRVMIVLAPLAASVVVTLAILRLGGHPLSIFNLFGLLLVVAIGSNYSLFLVRQRHDPARMPRVLTSLLLANGCTVAGFGVLALSQTPMLHGLGMPVAIGTFLGLLFTTMIMSPLQTVGYAERRGS